MNWLQTHNPFNSAGGIVLVAAVILTAIYLGWRNMKRSRGAPTLPSDPWVVRFAIVLIAVVVIFVITKHS